MNNKLFWILRLLWMAIFLAAILFFIAGLSPLYHAASVAAEPALLEPGTDSFIVNASRISQSMGLTGPVFALLEILILTAAFGVYLCIAGLVFWKRGRDRASLMTSFFLVVIGMLVAEPVITRAFSRIYPAAEQVISDLIILAGWTFFVAFLALFPDGKFTPRWTKWALALFLVSWVFEFVDPVPSLVEDAAALLALGVVIVAGWSQIYRYRKVSTYQQRQQSKWVFYGLMLFLLVSLATYPFTGSEVDNWLTFLQPLMLAIIPVTVGIAILRAGLWDVDVVIRKTLVYSVLTLLLVTTYIGTILILEMLFTLLSNQQSPVIIVISTLVIAALFHPLQDRIQSFIDRRFYRRKYDAARALARFAQAARDEVDLEHLTASLIQVTQDTLQPESVLLWLPRQRDEEK